MDTNLKNKKILILGFSKTGIAAARYFLRQGANVYISEEQKRKPEDSTLITGLEKLGAEFEFQGHSDKFIDNSDFCILSPSIPPEAEVLKKLQQKNIKYYSDLEYVSFNNNEKIVLVTGTNGKTTTTYLISHILSKKFNAPYCGNIGISPFDYLDKNVDYFVIEASSFQLNYSDTLRPKIGVFCNLTPDHILWHGTMENYFNAKAKPFKNQSKDDIAILNYDDEYTKKLGKEVQSKVCYFCLNEINDTNAIYLKNNKIMYKNTEIIDISQLKIVGPHNVQNAMCAISAAYNLGVDIETIRQALMTFSAPEHRLEYIRTIQDTQYYNDSKATNPEASIVAINSFENKKVVLIAGGRDKKTTLEGFIKAVKEKISKVILIGEAQKRFKDELTKSGYIDIVNSKTLEEAIDIASLDKPDVVLLSPACASFDMFESYEKRGEAFRKYVLSKK